MINSKNPYLATPNLFDFLDRFSVCLPFVSSVLPFTSDRPGSWFGIWNYRDRDLPAISRRSDIFKSPTPLPSFYDDPEQKETRRKLGGGIVSLPHIPEVSRGPPDR